jgi:MoxR-like ATPase
VVIGTQNPIESEGTYPLPEAQLDRFLIRTGIGYPEHDDEVDLVLRRAQRGTDVAVIDPILTPEKTRDVQKLIETVHVSEPVAHYIVDIVDGTRQNPRTEAGASPRGSLALLKMSRAWAAMGGRRYVLPDDVKAMAVSTLSHRLLLMPDQWVRGVQPFEVISEVVEMIPAPPPTDPGEDVGPVPQPLNFGDVQ